MKANSDNVIAERWIAAWNSHSPDKMLPLFADDILYEDVAFGEVSHGRAELSKFAASEFVAVPDLELKLLRSELHGGNGNIEWSFSGTDNDIYKTGKKFGHNHAPSWGFAAPITTNRLRLDDSASRASYS